MNGTVPHLVQYQVQSGRIMNPLNKDKMLLMVWYGIVMYDFTDKLLNNRNCIKQNDYVV